MDACRELHCTLTSDRTLVGNASAVFFFMWDFKPNYLPKIRTPEQRYVFFYLESPVTFMNTNDKILENYFNWTMTYRIDSDVHFPYGLFLKQSNNDNSKMFDVDANRLFHNRSKLVAWMVSNCSPHSKRDQYVNVLKKYIPVDVYGRCGSFHCPRNEQCLKTLSGEYKFYLSFENSVCRDYVTEKLWNSLSYKMVPVVLKRSLLISYGVPDSAFIAVDDFKTAKDLADYLTLVGSNEALYLKYFEWAATHYVSNEFPKHRFCQLCQMLADKNLPKKTYRNLKLWWLTESVCDADHAMRHAK